LNEFLKTGIQYNYNKAKIKELVANLSHILDEVNGFSLFMEHSEKMEKMFIGAIQNDINKI